MFKEIALALAEDQARRAQRAGEKAVAALVDKRVLEAERVVAVDREIKRDKRIGRREAAAIHALLKGRH